MLRADVQLGLLQRLARSVPDVRPRAVAAMIEATMSVVVIQAGRAIEGLRDAELTILAQLLDRDTASGLYEELRFRFDERLAEQVIS